MYQRSAVILEKYFAEKFYYKDRSNLKNNYENYLRLIEVLEKYQEISEDEDKIINECEDIAAKIKQIQKSQSSLYKRNLKLEEDRNSLFESIDESATDLGKQLERIEKEIDENNEQMKPIGQDFISALSRFNETSQNRSEHGRKRRRIEKEYRSILEKTISNIGEIDAEKVADVKKYIAEDNTSSSEELKNLMLRNGEKEKVPFDIDVIESSIAFGHNINKQEAKIFVDVYEKTNSLINETNNDTVRLNRYKKLAKDSKNKLSFISVQKEYLTQFLDNERLSVNLGKREHNKLMREACDNFDNDVEQINNLTEILLKETINRATQKMYTSSYHAEYLIELQKKEREFENKLDELNLVGQILNPNYWRIGSIEKIYATFDNIVVEEYGRDLSKYKIEEEPEQEDSEGFMEYYDNLEGEEDNDIQENLEEEQTSKEYDDDMENIDNDDEDDLDENDDNDDEEENEEDEFDDDDELDDEDFEDEDEDEFEDDDMENLDSDDDDDLEDEEEDDDYDEQDDDEEENEEDEFDDDDEEDYEDEDEDEDDDDDDYNDIDIILQNRKKILGKNAVKKEKSSKKDKTQKKKDAPRKKGIFGLGSKK